MKQNQEQDAKRYRWLSAQRVSESRRDGDAITTWWWLRPGPYLIGETFDAAVDAAIKREEEQVREED